MGLPEHLEQVPVRDLLRIEDDEHGLGVPGSSAANLLVGRVRCEASRVADCCRVNALDLPEFTLGPQKQPRPKTAALVPSGKGGSRSVPSTACFSGTVNAACSRPGRASVGMTILVLWRLKNTLLPPRMY